MKTLFLDAPYAGTVELCTAALEHLQQKGYKTVALYASVQFCNNLEPIKQQLHNLNITIISSKAQRTAVPFQLLGCDTFADSLNLGEEELQKIEAFIYVGDGKFHPYALAFAQKDSQKFKEIICNDPLAKTCSFVTKETITTYLNKHRASRIKFLSAKHVGILISTKPGQEYLRQSFTLEEKYSDKRFSYFVDNTISFDQLENFPFIECWVNTACPRIGFDDVEKFRKGVLNLTDALRAEDSTA